MARRWQAFGLAGALVLLASGVSAQTCVGTCGELGPDGVVTAPPDGSPTYQYVTSNDGTHMGGFGALFGDQHPDYQIGGTNGSYFQSALFSAGAGDPLEFYFNYVTSDGAGFADYAWAALLHSDLSVAALLFTARTTPDGFAVPGFEMPLPEATLDPSPVAIIPGAPVWSPLGQWSGTCFSTGCGYTGWIHSLFNIQDAGNYYLHFGVTNWVDQGWDSGMAWSGATVGGVPIDPPVSVPEPLSMLLLGTGLAGIAAVRRRRRSEEL